MNSEPSPVAFADCGLPIHPVHDDVCSPAKCIAAAEDFGMSALIWRSKHGERPSTTARTPSVERRPFELRADGGNASAASPIPTARFVRVV